MSSSSYSTYELSPEAQAALERERQRRLEEERRRLAEEQERRAQIAALERVAWASTYEAVVSQYRAAAIRDRLGRLAPVLSVGEREGLVAKLVDADGERLAAIDAELTLLEAARMQARASQQAPSAESRVRHTAGILEASIAAASESIDASQHARWRSLVSLAKAEAAFAADHHLPILEAVAEELREASADSAMRGRRELDRLHAEAHNLLAEARTIDMLLGGARAGEIEALVGGLAAVPEPSPAGPLNAMRSLHQRAAALAHQLQDEQRQHDERRYVLDTLCRALREEGLEIEQLPAVSDTEASLTTRTPDRDLVTAAVRPGNGLEWHFLANRVNPGSPVERAHRAEAWCRRLERIEDSLRHAGVIGGPGVRVEPEEEAIPIEDGVTDSPVDSRRAPKRLQR